MSDDTLIKLRVDQARGFAALKVLLEVREQAINDLRTDLRAQDAKVEELQRKVAALEAHQQDHREVTGRFLVNHEAGLKAQGALEGQKTGVERWKATAPIVVAVVSGIFGLIAGLISLISTLLGH